MRGMEIAARLGSLTADAAKAAERTIHRLAKPAALALAPVLLQQAKQLQRNLVWLPEPKGQRHGTIAAPEGGGATPLRLLAIGDSTATGVGAERLEDGLVLQTGKRLAAREQRPVAWRIIGLEGLTTAQVLERHLPEVEGEWDAILLLVGANDALQLVGRGAFARSIRRLVAGLSEHLSPGGVIGLTGTPQIDTFVWLPQPVRSLIGGHARTLDDVQQRIAADDPRVLHLPTPAIVEPEQHAADGFHPSAAGYRLWSSIVAPRVAQALARRATDAPAAETPSVAPAATELSAPVRRGIVPPYLLEQLAAAGLPTASIVAERTLGLDRGIRTGRETTAPQQPSLRPDAPVRVPGEPPAPHRTISDAKGATTLPGSAVRTEGEEPTDDIAVNQAYDGLGASWQLLMDAFGRDSLDGAGMPLLATVHYGDRYANAFWDGTRMVFGDGDGEVFAGFTNAVDVIGHELGHGVISSTADLVYRDQSGALNESIADVLGSLVKQHALRQSAEQADWLIGAGVFTDTVQGVALRSMSAPGTAYDDPALGKDPQPGHMRDFIVTRDDLGGVHINSGIPNKAFYLVATAIGGNAWEAPGLIWMDALTGSLDRTADFATFAAATVDASVARFGDDAAETRAVREAWAAVGVTDEAVPDAPVADEVRVARTGGMLGRTQAAVLELQVIPGDDRQQLDTLVASGVLEDLGGQTLPDAPLWRVTVETKCDVTVAEPLLPEEVLSLFRRLLELGDEPA
ncbi:GDSL-like Lipase/Acylhydrolase family protein [Agrococcus baldri]|uniref:GDSL-like Lipase/Acylhydrolase family protein n=2 Tax=Agrococcus baldri TaxID=153730 RepID=A0AA94HPG8_9MICO|nr:GDSL-like Lipase/Acylhydrolase family protein [Agrococcus baldri]